MNILKVLGVVVGIHVVAYLVIAQPGCRSTTAKPAAASTASAPAAAQPAPAAAKPVDQYEPVALNLPFAQAPAPGGERYAPTRPGAEQPAPAPAKTYTVQKGDSFYTIARKNGLTVDELTAANNLAKTSSLRIGQKLVIPGKGAKAPAADNAPVSGRSATSSSSFAPAASGATYTVKSGDTLSKIASRYHTTSGALRSLNGISGDHLRIGQVLQIPGNGASSAAPVASLPPPPAATPVTAPSPSTTPAAAGVHTVAAGESAESIARTYGITVGELVRANNITDPRKVRIGQVLTIPGTGAARAARPAPSLVPERTPAPAVAPTLTPSDSAPPAEALPENDAPVVPVDDAPPAVPVPQID
ncbi:MAG: LysM peptidoglycan-binding domain-containing protein [Opitutaceae bacterium]